MIASFITALYLLGIVSATNASNFLFLSGILLIAGEIALGTFWLVGFNGLLALFVGYAIRTGDNIIFGVPIDWAVVFGIAFIEFLLLITVVFVIIRSRRHKVSTGAEGMIGQKATVVEWNDKAGQVRIQGELWKAKSDSSMDLAANEEVTVSAVDGLILKVKA